MMMNSRSGTAIKLAMRLLGDSELKYQAIKGSVMICRAGGQCDIVGNEARQKMKFLSKKKTLGR